jgi:hypothetical protein
MVVCVMELYRPLYLDDPVIDETRCRAMAYDRVHGERRQCRMRPVRGELCRYHVRSEGMLATCPICLGPSAVMLCDTCQTAWTEADVDHASEPDKIRWIADRARVALRYRMKGKGERP